MKILITGGCGFIGSHLTEMLLTLGHDVLVIDSLVCGRKENLSMFKSNPKLAFLQADICDRLTIAPCFNKIDWVFHLAGLADIVPSIDHPDAYFQANVTGTLNVLQCAHDHGIKRLIYAASSSSYGIPDIYPTPEISPISPQYPYALTKYMGEALVLHWAKVYKLPTVSLRLFNVYGPRARTSGTYGAVFGVFLAQKLHGQPFTVVGDGSQTRDFTYVTDVANAFILAAQSGVCAEVMNVGSGNHYSIKRLVELLGGPIAYVPKRPGEPACTFADTAKIQALLGWKPKVSFETGVSHMLNSMMDWQDAPVWSPETIQQATASWFSHLG